MLDVAVIDNPEAAVVAFDPVRSRLRSLQVFAGDALELVNDEDDISPRVRISSLPILGRNAQVEENDFAISPTLMDSSAAGSQSMRPRSLITVSMNMMPLVF